VLGQGEPALLGRVGLRAVGVQGVAERVHRRRQLRVRERACDLGPGPVEGVQVDVLLGGRRDVTRPQRVSDDTDLRSSDHPVGERRLQPWQVLQHPTGLHHCSGCPGREVVVPAQQ
jgi:hypothetical protein